MFLHLLVNWYLVSDLSSLCYALRGSGRSGRLLLQVLHIVGRALQVQALAYNTSPSRAQVCQYGSAPDRSSTCFVGWPMTAQGPLNAMAYSRLPGVRKAWAQVSERPCGPARLRGT